MGQKRGRLRPRDELQFDREPGAAMQQGTRQEPGLRKEVVGGVDITVDKDILPRDEGVLQHKDGVVLIEAASPDYSPTQKSIQESTFAVRMSLSTTDHRRILSLHQVHKAVPSMAQKDLLVALRRNASWQPLAADKTLLALP